VLFDVSTKVGGLGLWLGRSIEEYEDSVSCFGYFGVFSQSKFAMEA
jgi:hypothetical protein